MSPSFHPAIMLPLSLLLFHTHQNHLPIKLIHIRHPSHSLCGTPLLPRIRQWLRAQFCPPCKNTLTLGMLLCSLGGILHALHFPSASTPSPILTLQLQMFVCSFARLAPGFPFTWSWVMIRSFYGLLINLESRDNCLEKESTPGLYDFGTCYDMEFTYQNNGLNVSLLLFLLTKE